MSQNKYSIKNLLNYNMKDHIPAENKLVILQYIWGRRNMQWITNQFYSSKLGKISYNKNTNIIECCSCIELNFMLCNKTCCDRCGQLGLETAQLISKLEYDEILTVLRCKEFNPLNLMYCLKLGTQLTLQVCECSTVQPPQLDILKNGYNDFNDI